MIILDLKRLGMLVENLTNRMWFSLVCTLIDNDIVLRDA